MKVRKGGVDQAEISILNPVVDPWYIAIPRGINSSIT